MKGLLLLTLSSLLCWVSGEHLGAPRTWFTWSGLLHLAPGTALHYPLLKIPSAPRPNWLSSPVPRCDRVLALFLKDPCLHLQTLPHLQDALF